MRNFDYDDEDPFDDKRGLARNDHPDTSHDAADDILPKSGTQRRLVYDCLMESGPKGLADVQMQRRLNMTGNTQRPRRVELVDAGLVADSHRRRRIDGHLMVVWIAVPP